MTTFSRAGAIPLPRHGSIPRSQPESLLLTQPACLLVPPCLDVHSAGLWDAATGESVCDVGS